MEHSIIEFCCELYPKESVMKAAYHFLDRCYIYIDIVNDRYIVDITAKVAGTIYNIEKEFKNELLAQSVRLQVYNQTHVIREVLMARAMASTITDTNESSVDVVEPDAPDSLKNVLTDWFEKNE